MTKQNAKQKIGSIVPVTITNQWKLTNMQNVDEDFAWK